MVTVSVSTIITVIGFLIFIDGLAQGIFHLDANYRSSDTKSWWVRVIAGIVVIGIGLFVSR